MSLLSRLEKSATKLTLQRRLIAATIDRQTQPFSAEDLHNQGLKKKRIDLATVYRTLSLFLNEGLLQKSEFGDRKSRYWKADANQHCQTLYCKECGNLETLAMCLAHDQHQLLAEKGYTNLSHKVEFIGICPECSSQKEVTP